MAFSQSGDRRLAGRIDRAPQAELLPARKMGPVPAGTVLLLIGLAITGTTLTGDGSSGLARYAAIGVGVSLLVSVAIDFKRGLNNVIRADVMALCALYFLTFFEFLFSQQTFDELVDPVFVRPGIVAVLWGFAGIAVGRHFLGSGRPLQLRALTAPVPPGRIIAIYTLALVVGYMHQLIAVEFDLTRLFDYYLAPRFAQPWGRGKYGDWKALLNELGLLIYLIPPIAGVVFAKRRRYSLVQILYVAAGFAWTLFYGFSSGTRNIFACFLVTFMIAYIFAVERRRSLEVLIMGVTVAALLLVSTKVMLEFRGVGLRRYLVRQEIDQGTEQKSLFVDYNLYVICGLVNLFPDRFRFMGWEVPYLALIRPVPRAIWPGKPEGLSVAIEEAIGVEGLTLAASFVGEAYLIDGMWTVFATGFLFGALARWWFRLASQENSDLGVLIYASGFFATVISMRSMFVFTTAVLPTIAAIVGGSMIVERVRSRRAQRKLGR